jgi:hypothetical protein
VVLAKTTARPPKSEVSHNMSEEIDPIEIMNRNRMQRSAKDRHTVKIGGYKTARPREETVTELVGSNPQQK